MTEAHFLEQAYDGAQARIEVLEERLRRLHKIVTLAAGGHSEWACIASEVLASMPDDPTLTE